MRWARLRQALCAPCARCSAVPTLIPALREPASTSASGGGAAVPTDGGQLFEMCAGPSPSLPRISAGESCAGPSPPRAYQALPARALSSGQPPCPLEPSRPRRRLAAVNYHVSYLSSRTSAPCSRRAAGLALAGSSDTRAGSLCGSQLPPPPSGQQRTSPPPPASASPPPPPPLFAQASSHEHMAGVAGAVAALCHSPAPPFGPRPRVPGLVCAGALGAGGGRPVSACLQARMNPIGGAAAGRPVSRRY